MICNRVSFRAVLPAGPQLAHGAAARTRRFPSPPLFAELLQNSGAVGPSTRERVALDTSQNSEVVLVRSWSPARCTPREHATLTRRAVARAFDSGGPRFRRAARAPRPPTRVVPSITSHIDTSSKVLE